MKTRFMIAIASTLFVAGLVCAQPQVPNPAAPEVPAVEEENEVGNPVQPDVPNAAGPPAVQGNSCTCPVTHCPNGDVSACAASCPGEQVPECSCNGFCDSDGNPRGLNRCRCQ